MTIIDENTFVTLDTLVNIFNLPKGYLRKLADENLIPSLNVNGRLRFNSEAVQKALDELATKGEDNES